MLFISHIQSTLTNQDIEGNIIIDSISSLTINLIGSSIKGKINEVNTAFKFAINLEECTFKYGSRIFLKAEGTSEWDSSGSNCGLVTLL